MSEDKLKEVLIAEKVVLYPDTGRLRRDKRELIRFKDIPAITVEDWLVLFHDGRLTVYPFERIHEITFSVKYANLILRGERMKLKQALTETEAFERTEK